MPPIVGILASVVVLLAALAIIVPDRPTVPPPENSRSLPPDSAPTTLHADGHTAEGRPERLARALVAWGDFKRADRRVKLFVGFGISASLSPGCASGALRAALERDWSGLIALAAASLFLAWAAYLCWRGLRLP